MAVRLFGTRLTVEGAQQYESTMRRAGRTGQESMERIERASRPASRGLRLVSAASSELQSSTRGLAASVPFVGRFASALGPIGIGVGVAAAGLAGLARGAREAAAEIARIGDAADRAGIEAGTFEALGAALRLEGQSDQGIEVALSTFNRVLGEARAGSKSAGEAFRRLGVDVAAVTAAGESSEQVLFRLADGFAAIQSPADRAAAAQRVFGEQGRGLVLALDQGSDALRRQFEAANDLGLLYGGDVIREAQRLNAEFDKQARIVGVQLRKAFLEAGPSVSALGDALVEIIPVLAKFVANVAAGVNELFALIGLAERPLSIRLAVVDDDLRKVQDELSRIEAGAESPSLAQRLGAPLSDVPDALKPVLDPLGLTDTSRPFANKSLAQLRELRDELVAEQDRLKTEIGKTDALFDILSRVPETGGGPALGGGGGKKPERDAFADEARRAGEQIARLKLEAEAAGLAADAAARLEAQVRLLTAARADGSEVSAEELETIRNLSEGLATATTERERATEAARAAADAERDAVQEAERLKDAVDGLGNDLGAALGGLITGTNTWKDALGQVLNTIIRIIEQPLSNALSGALGGSGGGIGGSLVKGIGGFIGSLFGGGFADGAAFSRGRVIPFAAGGIVTGPKLFPMAGGRAGLMGEAGPEAILPLTRTAGGQLGVRAQGGGGATQEVWAPTYNIDARGAVEGVAAQIERAISRYDRQVAAPSVRGASVRLRS